MERKLKKSNLKIGDEIVIYTKDNGKILPYIKDYPQKLIDDKLTAVLIGYENIGDEIYEKYTLKDIPDFFVKTGNLLLEMLNKNIDIYKKSKNFDKSENIYFKFCQDYGINSFIEYYIKFYDEIASLIEGISSDGRKIMYQRSINANDINCLFNIVLDYDRKIIYKENAKRNTDINLSQNFGNSLNDICNFNKKYKLELVNDKINAYSYKVNKNSLSEEEKNIFDIVFLDKPYILNSLGMNVENNNIKITLGYVSKNTDKVKNYINMDSAIFYFFNNDSYGFNSNFEERYIKNITAIRPVFYLKSFDNNDKSINIEANKNLELFEMERSKKIFKILIYGTKECRSLIYQNGKKEQKIKLPSIDNSRKIDTMYIGQEVINGILYDKYTPINLLEELKEITFYGYNGWYNFNNELDRILSFIKGKTLDGRNVSFTKSISLFDISNILNIDIKVLEEEKLFILDEESGFIKKGFEKAYLKIENFEDRKNIFVPNDLYVKNEDGKLNLLESYSINNFSSDVRRKLKYSGVKYFFTTEKMLKKYSNSLINSNLCLNLKVFETTPYRFNLLDNTLVSSNEINKEEDLVVKEQKCTAAIRPVFYIKNNDHEAFKNKIISLEKDIEVLKEKLKKLEKLVDL